MSFSKRFNLAFWILNIVPIVLVYTNNYLAESKSLEWSYDNRWSVSLWMYSIALLGSLYILISNYRSKTNSKLWYILAGISAIIDVLGLYTVYSFSSFGF